MPLRNRIVLAAVALACLGPAQTGWAGSETLPARQARRLASAPPGALTCQACHGMEVGVAPVIGGRPAGEIAAALAAFRAGTRESTVMDRIARGFDEAESAAIASWLAEAP